MFGIARWFIRGGTDAEEEGNKRVGGRKDELQTVERLRCSLHPATATIAQRTVKPERITPGTTK